MKQSTDKKNMHWLSRCRLEDCKELKVKCPVCKHFGHVVPHIMTGEGMTWARVSIQHSHFLEEQDGGRNAYCETDNRELILPNYTIQTWRMTHEGKRRFIEKWAVKLWETGVKKK